MFQLSETKQVHHKATSCAVRYRYIEGNVGDSKSEHQAEVPTSPARKAFVLRTTNEFQNFGLSQYKSDIYARFQVITAVLSR